MTDPLETSPRKRRPDARPAEILAAALDLFTERGFPATRLEDVARRAGLSKAAIYLYFEDKTSLLKAIVEATANANLATAAELIGQRKGPVAPVLRETLALLAARMTETRLPGPHQAHRLGGPRSSGDRPLLSGERRRPGRYPCSAD